MRRFFWLAALATAAVTVLVPGTSSGASAASCSSVVTSKGTLSAAEIGGNVSGTLDATGCDIGVYYDASHKGRVKGASISGATQYGVFVDGGAGDISIDVTSTTVDNIGHQPSHNGGQYGVGIYYYGFGAGKVTGTVSGDAVTNYQKGGIVVNGENADVTVENNAVIGVGPVGYIAQNGIQFGYGGGGQARNNIVNDNWYTGSYWGSTGILVFESGNVIVDRNTLTDNQAGLDAEAWCWVAPSASNNKFVDNSVSGSDYGVSVAAYAVDGYSTCNPSADNNKVTNNELSGTSSSGSEGVFVGTYSDPGFVASADNNKVVDNDISGFETPLDTGFASATKVHANAVS